MRNIANNIMSRRLIEPVVGLGSKTVLNIDLASIMLSVKEKVFSGRSGSGCNIG